MDVAVFKFVIYQNAIMEKPISLNIGNLLPSIQGEWCQM